MQKNRTNLLERAQIEVHARYKVNDGLCVGSSTFSITSEGIDSTRLDEICHANLFFDGNGKRAQDITEIALHTSLYKKGVLSYQYFRWLLKESPFRNVYKRTSIRKAMEVGLELKVRKYTKNQLLCAAIATRYTHEYEHRLSMFTFLYEESKHLGISQTAVWILLPHIDGYGHSKYVNIHNLVYPRGSHEVLHGDLTLKSFSSILEKGISQVYSKNLSGVNGKFDDSLNSVVSVLGVLKPGSQNSIYEVVKRHCKSTNTGWSSLLTIDNKSIKNALIEIQKLLDNK